MTELGSALARFDDVLRQIDGVLGGARSLTEHADASTLGMHGAADELAEALGPTMPDQLANQFASHELGAPMNIDQLVHVRTDMAQLGAVARGVLELGGVDAVARQGGLDAIDGAAEVVQRHLVEDARTQLDGARTIIDDAPHGLFATSGSRADHIRRVLTRIAAPIDTVEAAGGLTNTSAPRVAWRLEAKVGDKELSSALDTVRDWIDCVSESTPEQLDDVGSEFHQRLLTSSRAHQLGDEQLFAGLPDSKPLATLADDVVFDHAVAAFDRHVVGIEQLVARVGDAAHTSDEFTVAVMAAERHIRAAMGDASALEPRLVNAQDRARDAAWLIQDWGAYLLKHAGGWGARDNGPKMLPTVLEQVRSLRDELVRIADDPQLLHASTDAADEVRSVLERPGALDVGALRQLLDGDTPQAVSRALAAHVAEFKALGADAPPAATVEDARRLLDEADVISSAVVATASRRLGREEVALHDPQVAAATEQLLLRRAAALGIADRVPEDLGNAIRGDTENIRRKVLDPVASRYPASVADLERLDRYAAPYRSALVKVSERAVADGGLRSIPPSARPAQAQQAQASWLMRELDSLPAIAADAPPEVYVDTTARRFSLVADMLANRNGGTADGDVLKRVASDVSSVDDLWRYPDDTALTIARAQRMLEAGSDEPEAVAAHLRKASGELRAWSMLPDGTLPHTSLDRISVAARRSDAMRMAADTRPIMNSERPNQELETWVETMDTRLVDLDHVLGGAMPRAERTAVDDSLASLHANLEHHAMLVKSYSSQAWELDQAALDAARSSIETLDAAIARVHADARQSNAERLAW